MLNIKVLESVSSIKKLNWLSIIMQNSLLSLRLQVKFLKKFVKSLFFFICSHQFSENIGFKRSLLEICPWWCHKERLAAFVGPFQKCGRNNKASVLSGSKKPVLLWKATSRGGKHAVSLFLLSKFVWAWVPPRLGRGKNIIAFEPCWFLLPRAEYFFLCQFQK